MVQNDNATTEALANVQSFLAALQAGDPDQAKKELVKYATALLPGRSAWICKPAQWLRGAGCPHEGTPSRLPENA